VGRRGSCESEQEGGRSAGERFGRSLRGLWSRGVRAARLRSGVVGDSAECVERVEGGAGVDGVACGVECLWEVGLGVGDDDRGGGVEEGDVAGGGDGLFVERSG